MLLPTTKGSFEEARCREGPGIGDEADPWAFLLAVSPGFLGGCNADWDDDWVGVWEDDLRLFYDFVDQVPPVGRELTYERVVDLDEDFHFRKVVVYVGIGAVD